VDQPTEIGANGPSGAPLVAARAITKRIGDFLARPKRGRRRAVNAKLPRSRLFVVEASG